MARPALCTRLPASKVTAPSLGAQMAADLTRSLSLFGQLMLLLAFPAMMLGGYSVPWLAVLLLISAPTLSALLQLALSRTPMSKRMRKRM